MEIDIFTKSYKKFFNIKFWNNSISISQVVTSTTAVPLTLIDEMQGIKCAKKLGQLLIKYVHANLLKYRVKEWSENVNRSVTVYHTIKSHISDKKYCILDVKQSQCKWKSGHNASHYDYQLTEKLPMPT